MKKRFSEEQITMALRQAEAGTPVAEICRKLQITEQTFYRWKKKFDSLGTPEIRELRQLRDENKKLKQLVADLTLDKHILHESLKKSSEDRGAACLDAVGYRSLSGLRAAGLYDQRFLSSDDQISILPSSSGSPQTSPEGDRRCPGQLWIPPVARGAQTGRLAGQPHASLSAVR